MDSGLALKNFYLLNRMVQQRKHRKATRKANRKQRKQRKGTRKTSGGMRMSCANMRYDYCEYGPNNQHAVNPITGGGQCIYCGARCSYD